jgi:hypothetical protein
MNSQIGKHVVQLYYTYLCTNLYACTNYSLLSFLFRFCNLSIIFILPFILNAFFDACVYFVVHFSTWPVHILTKNTSSTPRLYSKNARDIRRMCERMDSYIYILWVFDFVSQLSIWHFFLLQLPLTISCTINVVYVFLYNYIVVHVFKSKTRRLYEL